MHLTRVASLNRHFHVLLLISAYLFFNAIASQASSFHVISGKCEWFSGTCELKIEGSGLSDTDLRSKDPPVLKDLSTLEPRLTFENEPGKTSDGRSGTRNWSFSVKTAGPLSGQSQDRTIALTFGASSEVTLTFTLVATAPKDSGSTIKWTLEPPATPWNLAQDRWTEFTVTISDKSLKSVVLKHSTYLDARPGRGRRLPLDQFYLCKERTTDLTSCSKPAALSGTTSTFWLTVDPRFDQPGTFTGNLEIDTDPHSDLKSLSPNINQTGPHSDAIGLLLILLGVTAAWLILAFGRGRFSRNQALLPAVLLRERAAGLVLDLDTLPDSLKGSAPNTKSALTQIVGKLSETFLDAQQFLPPRIPSSFGGVSIQATAYQTLLQNLSQLVDDLEAIVTQGIEPAAQKWSSTISNSDLALLKQLIASLDALSATLPQPLTSLRTSILTLLANWHPAVVALAAEAPALTITSPPPKGKTSFQILLQIEAITIVFWIVWAILTTLGGYLVLIQPNPGFGGGLDYVQCLLWGFGLPVAGQSLQQLSVSSINTQLGVTLPRS